jgi:hypothetical protein
MIPISHTPMIDFDHGADTVQSNEGNEQTEISGIE